MNVPSIPPERHLAQESESAVPTEVIRLWSVLQRRPVLPLAIALCAAVVAWIHTARKPDVYRAEGLVQLGLPAGMNMEPGEYVMWVAGRERIMRTQEQLLTSDSVVESAMDSLGEELPRGPGRRAAIQEFLAGVKVVPIEETFLVELEVSGPEPEDTARRANALLDAFIPFTNQFLVNRYVIMERQLSEDEERLRKKLSEAEAVLQGFYEERGSIQFDQRRETLYSRQKLVDARLSAIRLERAAMEAEREMLERGVAGPMSMGDQDLELLLAGLSQGALESRLEPFTRLRADLVEKEAELRSDHPEVVLLRQQLETQGEALRRLAGVALNNLRLREGVAAREEQKLQAMLETTETELARLERLDGMNKAHRREVDRLERELGVVRQRHLRVEGRTQMDTGSTLILRRAEVPQVPLPKGTVSVVVGAFVVFLIAGVGLIVFYELTLGTISTEDDARNLSLPILGRVPLLDKGQGERVVLEGERSRVGEAFRGIRTYLEATSGGEERTALLVTSGAPEMGKTFVSLNLAAAFARAGSRTLLVDGDLRKPRLHTAIGAPRDRGLSDLLRGEAALEDLVQSTDLDGLEFLASGPTPDSAADLLASGSFLSFVADALERYDRVLIDTPPADVVSDASLMARYVQRTILVVRMHRTRHRAARRVVEQMESVGAAPTGLVLNAFSALDQGFTGYGRYRGERYAYYGAESSS